jgi:hypothetical protein
VSLRAELSRDQSAVVIGAAFAGLFWGSTGFVALLDPGPDPGPVGSSSFYLIEGGHALAETGMFVALVGLWRSHTARIGRLGNVVFGLAAAATLFLAILTYLVVAASALGLGENMPDSGQTVPPPLIALASALFLFTLVGLLAGYTGSGVTTIRAAVWPPLIGWLLIAHLVLLAGNLVIYPIGIGIGVLWLTLALVAGRAAPAPS